MAAPKWISQCRSILDNLFSNEDSEPFHEPVDYHGLGLTDYPKIIKNPMDLGTIQGKLDRVEYRAPSEFAFDVRLVWDNCKLYNQEGSDFYVLAQGLSDIFEDLFKGVSRSDVPRSESTEAPNINAKTEFSKHIFRLQSDDLARVIHILTTSCEKALVQVASDEIDIVVDDIDPETFWELDSFVKKCVPTDQPPVFKPKRKRKASDGTQKEKAPRAKKQKVAKDKSEATPSH